MCVCVYCLQLETTVTMDEVTPGLKAALSASLPEVDSGKVTLPPRYVPHASKRACALSLASQQL